MTDLYIANCTKHVRDVHYRLPESARVFNVKIPPMGQAAIPHKNLTNELIDFIVRQLTPYGLRPEKTVHNVREHVGMVYAIGKPVDMSRTAKVAERNDEILTEQVHETLKDSLVVADHVVQSQTGGEGKVNTVEIEEVVPANESRKGVSRKLKLAGRN